MNKNGQLDFDLSDILKIIGILLIAFFMFGILSAIANSIQDIQTSIETIIATFIPLIILAAFFEIVRRIFR